MKKTMIVLLLIWLVAAFSGCRQAGEPAEKALTSAETAVNSTQTAGDKLEKVSYDSPPSPVGGMAAIQKALTYPESARKEEVQGTVKIKVQIGIDGTVVDTEVIESLHDACDSAAVKAIRAVQWKPAMKGNNPVKVWIMVPIQYRLS